jgi:hypothetical protein
VGSSSSSSGSSKSRQPRAIRRRMADLAFFLPSITSKKIGRRLKVFLTSFPTNSSCSCQSCLVALHMIKTNLIYSCKHILLNCHGYGDGNGYNRGFLLGRLRDRIYFNGYKIVSTFKKRLWVGFVYRCILPLTYHNSS